MAVVAVAGGKGGMGKTIVDQLQQIGKHKVFILGRQAVDTSPAPDAPEFLQCDYQDINGLVSLLESMTIDTIISTIHIGTESAVQAQLNLIAAAERSKNTRRFIPSHYMFAIDNSNLGTENPKSPWFSSAIALKKSSLEYTHVANGFFMDYWGMPYVQSSLDPFTWGIDLTTRKAVIPGSGDDIFSVTYSVDIGRFMAALLNLEKWPTYSKVSGSDITLNQVVALAEEITGGKFDISYDDEGKIKNKDSTLLGRSVPGVTEEVSKAMIAEAQLQILNGRYHLPEAGRLNDVFPWIHPVSVEEFLSTA